MSGYGGQPPAWNDPYGQNQGQGQGWRDPYGADTQPGWDPYGQYPRSPTHDYGPPGVPPGRGTPGSAIAALVCTSVAVAMCCNVLAIPGIVTSVIAVNRSRTDPASTRNLTAWSWVILGVALAVQIIVILVLIILDVNSAGHDSGYDSGGI
jgi:hypothetical protein